MNATATMNGHGTTSARVRPTYNGVAVWRSMSTSGEAMRTASPYDAMTVLDEPGDGWLHVQLADGADGYVRANAVRTDLGQPPAPAARNERDFPARNATDHAFPGAPRIATALTVFAWLSLIGGQLIGFGAAASLDCGNAFLTNSHCTVDSSSRFELDLAIAIPTLLVALSFWTFAYGLLLLDRIELNSAKQYAKQ